MTARILPDDDAGRAEAVRVLRAGGIVALPTDTVYGIGVAWAARPDGIERLFAAKRRPAERAIVVLLADSDQARELATLTPAAERLAAAFWPGGLTLVVPQRPDVGLPAALTGGAPTIGLRLPDHPTPRALAAAVGPIPTTSANRSGRPEGRDAAEIVDQVGDAVDLVLDGGPAHGGPASTVVDCSGDRPRVLRVGAVPLADVVAALDRAGLPHALVVGRRG